MTSEGEVRKRSAPKSNNAKGKTPPAQTTDVDKQGKSASTSKPEKPVTYTGQVFRRSLAYLFEQEDASYLAVFRILWGTIMAYEAFTYTWNDFGKMNSSFYNSTMQFKYYLCEWAVVPEDPFVLKCVIVMQLIAGIGMSIGFFYRTSCLAFFLLFTYTYLLEQAMYLNHFYLVCILNMMMLLLPCNCLFSIDAILWPKRVYSPTCPKWCLLFVKLELAIVYTYAGVCKINDDWLRGQPLRQWLTDKDKIPLIGKVLVLEPTAYFMSYGGLIYDLIVAELLFFQRTKLLGIACSVFFHVMNKLTFDIGIFPWMMLASTTFYFRSDWPRLLIHRITGGSMATYRAFRAKRFSETAPRKLTWLEVLTLLLLTVFLLQQLLTPVRLHLYPGDVAWNEYGHQFSWRMKLRTKKCDSAVFAYNPEYHQGFEIPIERFLNTRQYRKMSSRPDMVFQFAEFVGAHIDEQLRTVNITTPTEVYMESWCELNGRPFQRLVNPNYNIASRQNRWQYPYPWVEEVAPLTEEEKQDYPWNWEWNFNWLKGKNLRLPPKRYSDQAKQAREMLGRAFAHWEREFKKRDPQIYIHKLPSGSYATY